MKCVNCCSAVTDCTQTSLLITQRAGIRCGWAQLGGSKGASPDFPPILESFTAELCFAEHIFSCCTAQWSHFFFKYINIYSISSRPSPIITQAARMCSDACVCPPDESLHYRLAPLQRRGFKGTCLNNLTLLQTGGWWRSAGSLRNHFAPHASKIIIFSCCITYQIFTLYPFQQQNTFTTKLICYGRDRIFSPHTVCVC